MKNKKTWSITGTVLFSFLLGSFASAQTLPDGPAMGARLFVAKECVRCHALKGKGGKIGPDFGRVELGDTQLDLAAKLWNHIPSMMAGMERARIIRPKITGQEFSELIAYLYFLKFFDEPGDPARGKLLFTEKACSACHPISGRGKQGNQVWISFRRTSHPFSSAKPSGIMDRI